MIYRMRRLRKSILFFGKSIVIALLVGVFVLVWRVYYPETVFYPDAAFFQKGNLTMTLLYAAVLLVFVRVYNATKFGVFRLMEIIYSFLICIFLTNAFTYLQLALMARKLLPLLPMLQLLCMQMFVAVFGAYLLNKLYFMLYPAREVLVIRPADANVSELIKKLHLRRERYHVRAVISGELPLDQIKAYIDQYQTVMVGNIDLDVRREIFNYCAFMRKRLYIIPNSADVMVKNSHHTQLFDTPLYYCKNVGFSMEQAIIKRLLDVFVSLCALILTSPIMIFVAICIKIEDGGPIFFSQERLTRGGHSFKVHKFRSMVMNAEKAGTPQLAEKNDPRVTKVGRVIRRLRIDELPQFINVLMGQMSVVGPRPERPKLTEAYEKEFPEFRLRLRVKAGLTGYAQLYGKYNTTPKDKLLLDLMYIEDYSVILDLKLMMMTIKILFMPDSTEGFDTGKGIVSVSAPEKTEHSEKN